MKIAEIEEYVKLMLGYPTISLYTNDETIKSLCEEAFNYIKPFCFGDKMITVNINNNYVDLTKYGVEQVSEVIPASGTCLNENIFTLDKSKVGRKVHKPYKDIDIPSPIDTTIKFFYEKPILYVNNYGVYGRYTIRAICNINPEETTDNKIVSWVKRYSLALVKEVEGRIRSKFKSSNSPIELDGDILLSEAQQEKEQCISELTDKSYSPILIVR